MLKLKTDRQCKLIVNNVIRACYNIEALKKCGYDFLYLASGFIAHYSINGFKGYYASNCLITDILRNYEPNLWLNFTPKDNDYQYYWQKADIYKEIVRILKTRDLIY